MMSGISRVRWDVLVVQGSLCTKINRVYEFQAVAFQADCEFLVAIWLCLVTNSIHILSLKSILAPGPEVISNLNYI